jgi:hypothetical protein
MQINSNEEGLWPETRAIIGITPNTAKTAVMTDSCCTVIMMIYISTDTQMIPTILALVIRYGPCHWYQGRLMQIRFASKSSITV